MGKSNIKSGAVVGIDAEARTMNVELFWNGKRHRFQMLSDDACIASSVPGLSTFVLDCVYAADGDLDEWVLQPRRVLAEAKADSSLLDELDTRVWRLESVNHLIDSIGMGPMGQTEPLDEDGNVDEDVNQDAEEE